MRQSSFSYSGVGTTTGGTVSQARHAYNCREYPRFSDRELGILCHIAAGATNDEAASLNLSAQTVAGHLRAMMSRSQSRDRAELAVRAYAAGILAAGVWPPAPVGAGLLVQSGQERVHRPVRPELQPEHSASKSSSNGWRNRGIPFWAGYHRNFDFPWLCDRSHDRRCQFCATMVPREFLQQLCHADKSREGDDIGASRPRESRIGAL
jgi:DNA-binding CsgD family transcriptional regulator